MEMTLVDIAFWAIALLLGGAVGWFISKATARTDAAESRADRERLRAEAEAARKEASEVRTDVATAQADAAEWRAEAEKARGDLAAAQAATATAVAERDAALARVSDAAKDRENVVAQFKALSSEVLASQTKQAEASAEQRLKATDAVLAPVKENLKQLQDQLVSVQQQRAALDAELKAQVSSVKTASEQLRAETNALGTALRKPQTRGVWGESTLVRVVEAAGMKEHVDFDTQFVSSNAGGDGVRPDLKVHLGDGRFVFVDSKVPMEGFLDALGAADETQKAQQLKRVAKHLRKHVDDLSAKEYFTADGGTPEFVVLFIPHEAMAMEALDTDATLYEYAFAKNIVLATPSTLIAMLKAVRYSWQQHALADNARHIAELGAELYRRTGTLADHFDKIGSRLKGTVDAYNGAVGSFERSWLPQARRMHELGVKGDPLAELGSVTVDVREPKPAEIVPASADEPLQLEFHDSAED